MKNYCPIDLPDYFPKDKLPFGLFIYLQKQFILFRDKGEIVDRQLVLKLKNQTMSQLFVSKENVKLYLRLLNSMLDDALSDNSKLDTYQKAQVVSAMTGTSIKQMAENPADRNAYLATEKASKGMIGLLNKDEAFMQEFFMQNQIEQECIIGHSKNVALLALAFGEKLNFQEKDLIKLAVASLLHDIGFLKYKDRGIEVFKKDKSQFSKEEKKIFHDHGKFARNMLTGREWVDSDVLDLIENHELTLQDNPKLSILNQVLSMANHFEKFCRDNSVENNQECSKQFKISFIGQYDLKLFALLPQVVGCLKKDLAHSA